MDPKFLYYPSPLHLFFKFQISIKVSNIPYPRAYFTNNLQCSCSTCGCRVCHCCAYIFSMTSLYMVPPRKFCESRGKGEERGAGEGRGRSIR